MPSGAWSRRGCGTGFAFLGAAAGDHLSGDIDGEDEDAFDAAVGGAGGLIDEVEVAVGENAVAPHVELEEPFVAEGWAAVPVDVIEELEDALSGDLGKGFRDGTADEGRLFASGDAGVLLVDHFEDMAGAADDRDGGRGLLQQAAPAGALGVRLEAEVALLFGGLAAEGGDGEVRGDAGQQLARAERLGEIVVGAGVEALDAGLFSGAGGEKDDGKRSWYRDGCGWRPGGRSRPGRAS